MALLTVASAYDLRERTVPDDLWVIGSTIGVSEKLLNMENMPQLISGAWPSLLILLIMLALEWMSSGQADVLTYPNDIVRKGHFRMPPRLPHVKGACSRVSISIFDKCCEGD